MAVALILYPRPNDLDKFNDHYRNRHAPLVKKIRGLKSLKVSRNPVATLAGEEKYFMAIELEFASKKEMQQAFQSPESQAAAADLVNFAPPGRIRFAYERRSLMPMG